ncbi:MAG: adenylate kinase [Bacteroidetes bacterium GWF2_41_61]|nr:MAG: adenylate kinase [Bacteroidetes bacterium GWE2_40_15]OFY35747.1 MAG: adenylate kinase [Bacteroidetes bacterium GWF2_41_61]OFY91629.1 MAG: adenylate kinase [Bacteroidetes bacterium RIFOXYA12_FULL_40_10]HBG23675.1 adenylate kinase [Rikenellaceae bacterium]HBZ25214.1 adenylate kinase [Rikenellaceae bacterium]
MKNFIIFGPPGAGKGSQAVILAKKYNLKHISTGDILREEIKNGTKLGLKVKSLMDEGALVSDDIILEIIESVILNAKGYTGFLYDGFPRTVYQFSALDEFLQKIGQRVDAVISLVVKEEVIIRRMLRRAEIEGRADDADINVVKTRIETYREQTEPLIEIFQKRGNYYPLEGDTTIEKNFNEICTLIDSLG